MGSNKITFSYTPTDNDDLVNKKYLDTFTIVALDVSPIVISSNLNLKVNKSGDTMSGDLNMGPQKIISTYMPTGEADLINKKHLDGLLAQRFSDNDLRIIMNNLSLKANRSGEVFIFYGASRYGREQNNF